MALYQNGILISGANKLPQMTYAEWQALPAAERPSEWICTDRSYSDLPASDVTYDNTDSGLSADNIQDAIDEVAQSGGGGGHTIVDPSGQSMSQENKLQFTDAGVADDSTNGKTKVSIVREMTKAQYDALSEVERKGVIRITDEPDIVMGDVEDDKVEVTGDGSKNIRTLLNELYAKIDRTKLVENTSWIDFGDSVYSLRVITSNALYFERSFGVLGEMYHDTLLLSSSGSDHIGWVINTTGNTRTQYATTEIPTDGKVIPLYYGTQSAPIELTTDAEHCMMSDGESVEQALTINTISETKTVTPSVGNSVYKDFTMPNDGKKYACTVTVALGTSKSAKAEMWAGGTALLSSIAATFINVSDMPIDCAQSMTLFANGNGGNLRVYIWTRSTDCDTYTIKFNAISI